MKKSIAVLSALLIGLSYCPPGSVVMGADDSKVAEGNQNTENAQALSADDEKVSLDQVLSEDDVDSSVDQESFPKDESSLVKRIWKKISGIGEKDSLQRYPDIEIQQEAQIEDHKTEVTPVSGIKNLQIPQKLAVVIDPWEMDGKGQVYSEPYIIRNTGDTPGILTLSNLACTPSEQSGVVVKTDKAGLHDTGDKSIYIEMLLGNENRIIFTAEKSQYQTELNPGEELDIRFAGEVNENAFGEWTNQDVTISVVYSWETKRELDNLELEEEQTSDPVAERLNGLHQADTREGESADCQQTDTSEEEASDQQQDDAEDTENREKTDLGEEKQGSNPQEEIGKEPSNSLQTDVNQENISTVESDTATSNADIQKDTSANINAEDFTNGLKTDEGTAGSGGKEKEEIKNIDLQESQKVDVNIDSWKIDEKGRIVSQQYFLYNVGDSAGTWTLSELVCKPQEQNGVRVTADKKSLHDGEGKAVYMELWLGNVEKVVLSQESSTYEVKLRAGEKLAVRFIGEVHGNLFESREEGDIAVAAVCSWSRD